MNDILHNETPKNDIDVTRRRLLCPSCGKHTVLWLLPDTEIKKLPVKCKRCGKEVIVNVEPLRKAQNFVTAKVDFTP